LLIACCLGSVCFTDTERSITLKKLEEVRAELLKAMNTALAEDPESINKSADQVLVDAIQSYLTTTADVPAEPAPKSGKRIKEKGIAITHMELQGGAANKRNTPLLMKANGVSLNVNKAALENADPEILAALAKLGYVLGGE
jgi:hypothetical protein